MAIAPGTRLGPYEIVAPLGEAGMGDVYEARDTRVGRTVAIKVLPERLAESPERWARFEREAKAVAALSHPSLCTLLDVGSENGMSFLVTEHLEGETIAARLEKGLLPAGQAVDYVVQMAEGLEAAHQAGIVHRDLTAANVMLTKTGVKLLDFGLTRWLETAEVMDGSDAPTQQLHQTHGRTPPGAPRHMSSVRAEGKPLDARADIHALGAVLYEMVTGRKPPEGERPASLANATETSLPPPPSEPEPETSLPTPPSEPESETSLPTPPSEPEPETSLPTPPSEPEPETSLPTPPSEPEAVSEATPALQDVVDEVLATDPDAGFGAAHDVAFALNAPTAARDELPAPRAWNRAKLLAVAVAVALLASLAFMSLR